MLVKVIVNPTNYHKLKFNMLNNNLETDTELLLTHYKSIQFNSSTAELWDRSSQGKTIGIRTQTMLPQIILSPNVLYTLSKSTRQKKIGLCIASKYSPTHYLSLTAETCTWPETSSLPIADYLIYLKPISTHKIIDNLYHEEKLLENFLMSLEKIVSKNTSLEVLDLCRSMIMFSRDKYCQKLLVKSEILFPYANLLFTPINMMKLVNSKLTRRLIQVEECQFESGVLTMDQGSRIVPLENTDSLVLKYPVLGIWVKGIPQTNSANKTVNLVHPLVWAACMKFILNKNFKEKISPCQQTCTFLFIDFSFKVKFYEVSVQKTPSWKTSSFSAEISLTSDNFEPLQISFLKKDTRFVLKQAVSESMSYHSQSTCNSRSSTPPTAKPPIRKLKSISSQKELEKPKTYDKIIVEQTKLIEKLQAQVLKLQSQIISPKSNSYIDSPDHSEKFKNSAETNTTFSVFQNKMRLKGKKINFDPDERTDEMEEDKRNRVYATQKFKHPNANSEKIPQINYNSISDSSEEEDMKNLQVKYLSKSKK